MRPLHSILVPILLLGLACGGGAPPTEAVPTKVEAEAPSPPVASAPPKPETIPHTGTHCTAQEVAWVSCTTKGKKVASICSNWPLGPDGGQVFYRFGPLGAPELVYPSEATQYTKDFRYVYYEDTGGQARLPSSVAKLSFQNGDVKYTLHHTLVPKNVAELRVDKGDKRLATLPCTEMRGELTWFYYEVGWGDVL